MFCQLSVVNVFKKFKYSAYLDLDFKKNFVLFKGVLSLSHTPHSIPHLPYASTTF